MRLQETVGPGPTRVANDNSGVACAVATNSPAAAGSRLESEDAHYQGSPASGCHGDRCHHPTGHSRRFDVYARPEHERNRGTCLLDGRRQGSIRRRGEGVVLGIYYMRPNQAGGGRHVCNCGYITGAAAAGRGIARRMCEHSLKHARSRGYRAMQFNFVVSTNERAVKLWQSLGFEIVGRLPAAFSHPIAGYVDAFVMYQQL